MKRTRAGKSGRFKRKITESMSASLTAEETARLNELAADHGGAGRAIQVAVEHLHLRRRPLKIEEPKEGRREPFSFAVFPRTREVINSLSVPYGTKSNVIRACIEVLDELRDILIPLPDEPREAS